MANATNSPGPVASILGAAAYHFSLLQPHLPVYAHMLISSVLPIYAGAHASLSRPSSAAKRSSSSDHDKTSDGDAELEQEEEETQMEGLTPGDALLFPILAAVVLTTLYVLIKWLEDPAILNKVLGWYFAVFGVFWAMHLLSDIATFIHSLCLPVEYVDRGIVWKLDFKTKKARPIGVEDAKTEKFEEIVKECEAVLSQARARLLQEKDKPEREETERQVEAAGAKLTTARRALEAEKRVEPKASPLPGPTSCIILPARISAALWTAAEIPRKKIILKINVRRKTVLSAPVTLFNSMSLVAALFITFYFNTVSKPWYLTNLFGFSHSYGSLQLMSPTTFATGALLLSALFLYDIYMVFFTYATLPRPCKLNPLTLR